MTERFMIDDAGTLIDMHTRDTFDYVSDVVTLLNELHEEKEMWKRKAKWYKESLERNGFKVKCKELEE